MDERLLIVFSDDRIGIDDVEQQIVHIFEGARKLRPNLRSVAKERVADGASLREDGPAAGGIRMEHGIAVE